MSPNEDAAPRLHEFAWRKERKEIVLGTAHNGIPTRASVRQEEGSGQVRTEKPSCGKIVPNIRARHRGRGTKQSTWREGNTGFVLDARDLKHIKEAAPAWRIRVWTDTFSHAQHTAMPANEETLGETLDQTMDLQGRFESSTAAGELNGRTSVPDNNQINGMNEKMKSAEFGDVAVKSNDEKGDVHQSLPRRELHEKFIRDAFEVILEEAVFQGTSRRNRVVEWTEPTALRSVVDLELRKNPSTHETLIALIRNVVRYSVKTGHPHFINQLFSSLDPYGLVGQWLTDALNPSVYTYEVSPVFSLMEEEVLREMRKIVGFKDARGEGIFCPGGSMANGYAINLARHHKCPKLKEVGLSQSPRLVVFTSEDAHYSVKKLAAFLGIGTDNVYSIKVDDRGKMNVTDLESQVVRALDEGAVPLMVSATSGTTVMGAFDPLRTIAAICKKYKMWFHVDAAWGGGALMSRKHRTLLDGVELADSVTWNPHKLLAAPQQCSTLLIQHEGLLQSAHGSKATYLFQKDKFYDTRYDSGDKHVQCGRRADVLKFWFMWKAKGTSGLEKHVDRVFELSKYFADFVRQREGWKLLTEPECTNVCCWYVPPSMRKLEGDELDRGLHKVAPIIKERMMRNGSMLITYQPLRGLPNFFRLVLQNSGLTEADMRFFAEEIERLSADL